MAEKRTDVNYTNSEKPALFGSSQNSSLRVLPRFFFSFSLRVFLSRSISLALSVNFTSETPLKHSVPTLGHRDVDSHALCRAAAAGHCEATGGEHSRPVVSFRILVEQRGGQRAREIDKKTGG